MRVPSANIAHVDPAKVRDYLLSPSHPTGSAKYAWFARLGYSPSRWTRLEADLLRHVRTRRVMLKVPTPYGTKYIVRGRFRGPSGRTTDLVTVWMIRDHEAFPRFVAATPGGTRS